MKMTLIFIENKLFSNFLHCSFLFDMYWLNFVQYISYSFHQVQSFRAH